MIEPSHRRPLILMGVGLGLIVLVRFVIAPMVGGLLDREARLRRMAAQVGEMVALGSEYASLREGVERIRSELLKKRKDFVLASAVSALMDRLKLGGKVVSLKPGKSLEQDGFRVDMLDVSLKDLNVQELQGLLYALEVEDGTLDVSSLSFKKSGNGLDASLSVRALTPL